MAATRRRLDHLLSRPPSIYHLRLLPAAAAGQQASTTQTTQWALEPASGALDGGWVQLTLPPALCAAHGTPWTLRFDTGRGFEHGRAARLSPPTARPKQSILQFFPPHLIGLRLEARSSEVSLASSMYTMQVCQISKQEALARAAWHRLRRRRLSLGSLWRGASTVVRTLRRQGVAGVVRRLAASSGMEAEPYKAWLATEGSLSHHDRQAMAADVAQMEAPPTISVLMPVYNPKPEHLREAIDSVRDQVYPHWQLCIADDHSSLAAVKKLLVAAAAAEPRISVVYRPTNGHICAASNSALKLATGEWLVLLDHDDVLAPHALYCVANEALAHPQAAVIYSDEDKLDERGQRYEPHFKPDWNADLLLAQNYISHLGAYRRTIVERLGGFRPGYEGSQDHDLVLRVSASLTPDQIRHIPHVLYHWRVSADSTAAAASQKPYAHQAGERAVADHLKRQGLAAEVVPSGAVGVYRIKHPLPSPLPKVALIVPTRDRVDLLARMLQSLRQHTDYSAYNVVVVDNQSRQHATLQFLHDLQQSGEAQVLRHDASFNFAAICNAAARSLAQAGSDATVYGFLNNDLEITASDWLSEMVRQVMRPQVGAVGAQLLFPDDSIQHAGIICGLCGVASHAHKYVPKDSAGYFSRARIAHEFTAVTGACLMVRRQVFEQVGGFDEAFSVAYNDVDFCLRLRAAGYTNIYTPHAQLTHHESASRGADTGAEKAARLARESALMQQRWRNVMAADPFYNPNLTLMHEDFSLAFPSRAPKSWHKVR